MAFMRTLSVQFLDSVDSTGFYYYLIRRANGKLMARPIHNQPKYQYNN